MALRLSLALGTVLLTLGCSDSPGLSGVATPDAGPTGIGGTTGSTTTSSGVDAGSTSGSSSGTSSRTTTSSSSTHAGTSSGSSGGSTTDAPIGPDGGVVGLLHFGAAGDTRPGSSNDAGIAAYPEAIIDGIANAFGQAKVQFVLDLGDHMNNWEQVSSAKGQMDIYQKAMALFPGQWFLTMGNHECDTTAEVCVPGTGQTGSTAGNFTTFLAAVAKTGVGDLPWYSFDIQTSMGLARFVVIADNAWCPAQQTWLQNVLTQADTLAAYTIIARHHPPDDTSNGDATDLTEICTIVRQHKFALWLTAHVHEYLHIPSKDGNRDVIMGGAGAPLGAASNAQAFYGYLIVDQLPSGDLQVTAWDSTTSVQMDQWTVGPN
jgi:hypothetical protein